MTFKAIFKLSIGHYDLTAEFNEKFNPTIFNIDTKIFFRNLHLLLLFFLILFIPSLLKIKILYIFNTSFFVE